MKVERDLFLCAENVVLDGRNRVSIINIFDKVLTPGVPALMGRLMFFARCYVYNTSPSDTEIKVLIELTAPSGDKIGLPEPVSAVVKPSEEGPQTIGTVVEVPNIVFGEFGTYIADYSVNGEKVSSTSLEVVRQDANNAA